MTGRSASFVQGRATDIERHKVHQLRIAHFRQQRFGALSKDFICQSLLVLNHLVDSFFQRPSANQFVDQDVSFLSDAEGPVCRLILHRRVPPAVEMNDVRCGSQIQPRAACFH
jgi:hypothetical protein